MNPSKEIELHGRLWILIIISALLSASLAACAPAAAQPDSTAPAVQSTQSQLSLNPNAQKISARLQTLMNNPALAASSAEEQSKAFSLPPSGGGSIRFDQQGRVLVNIRAQDTSDRTLKALKDAGAIVQSVSAQYQVISAYVSALDLQAIANLAPVLSLEEELAPEMQGGTGS